MSPLRQQILEAIDRTSDEDLHQVSHLLESLKRSSAMPSSPSVQTWQTVLDRLEQFTPEKQHQQGQAVSELLQRWDTEEDAEEHSETWAFLQTALDHDRLSDRPLFP